MAIYTEKWPRTYALNTVTELELTTSQNISQNYTRVNYVVRVKKINNWNDNWTPRSGGSYLALTIGGTTVRSGYRSNWTTLNNAANATAVVDSGYVDVYHNADGTRVIDYRMELDTNVATIGTMPNRVISGSFRAATIPRASSFTVDSSTLNTGSNYTVSITRASTDFTHRVYRRIGGSEVELTSSAVATSCVINMPHSLFNSFPNSEKISASIVVKTFRGTTQVGSSSQNVTISLVSTAVPTFKDMTVSNSDSRPFSDKGQMIRGVSRLTLGTKDVKGSYSSRITSYEFSYQRHGRGWETAIRSSSKTYTYPAFSFPENGSVSLNVRSRVRDSRGRYSSWVTVRDAARVHYYAPPSIGRLLLRRTGSDLATIQVYRSHSVTPLYEKGNESSQKNTANLRFQTRQIGSGTDTESEKGRSSSLSTSADWVNLSGSFDTSKSYRVRAILSDARQTVYGSWMMIGTESVPLDIGPRGVGVGKVHEEGGATLQVKGGRLTAGRAPAVDVEGDLIIYGGGQLYLPHGPKIMTLSEVIQDVRKIQDTRSVNSPPDYYTENYPQQIATEFKQTSVMGFPSYPGGSYVTLETFMPWKDGSGGGGQIAHGTNASFIRPLTYETTAGGGRRYVWGNWRVLHSADQPWTPLSVQGGLQKAYNESIAFSVKNGVGYLKFGDVYFGRVHSGSAIQVSQLPTAYAPTRDVSISLGPNATVMSHQRMVLVVRTNGNIDLVTNSHAGAWMISAAVPLI